MSKQTPKYFTHQMWTDAYPFEVVKVVSEQTVEVRSMASKIDPTWKPEMHVGGFSAHCSNQRSQRWLFESNPEGRTYRLRRKKHPKRIFKGWTPETGEQYETAYDWVYKGMRFVPSDKPRRFHDYNF
jgi:hypothetical protein